MASAVLEIVIRATNQATRAIEETKKQMQGLRTVGDTLLKTGAMMTGLGVAIATPIGKAVKTFMSFEQAMKNVAVVAGATKEEFEKLEKAAREMGKKSVFSAKEAADAMYYLASAGMKTEQIVSSLEGVMSLAAATQSDLAQAADTVTATLSQFGLAAEEASRVADVFTAAISNSQATLTKLQYSLKYVGPIAKSVGWSLEETTAALMALYNAGFKGEQAGTILREMLSRLLNPSQEMIETFESLGIEVYENSEQLLGLVQRLREAELQLKTMKESGQATKEEISHQKEVVKQLKEELKHATVAGLKPMTEVMKELEKAGLTTGQAITLFGQEAGPGVLALLQTGTKAIEDYQKTLEAASGTATKAAKEQTDTLAGALKLLKSAFEELMISVGKTLAPALKDLAEKLRGLVEWFNNLPAPVKEAITKFGALSAAILTVGGGITMMVGGIVKAIATWKEFVAVIGTLKNLEHLSTMLGNIGSVASTAFSTLASAGQKAFSALVTAGKSAITGLQALFAATGPWGLVIAGIIAGVALIIANWDKVKEFFTKLWGKVAEITKTAWEGIKEFLKTTWEGIKAVATKVWEGIKSFFSKVWDGMIAIQKARIETLKKMWEGIKTVAVKVWEGIKTAAATVWDFIVKSAEAKAEIYKKIWTSVAEFFKKIWTGFVNIVATVVEFFKKAWSGFLDFWKKLWESAKKIFSSIMDGIIATINFAIKGLNRLIDLINKIPGVEIGHIPTLSKFGKQEVNVEVNVEAGLDKEQVINQVVQALETAL